MSVPQNINVCRAGQFQTVSVLLCGFCSLSVSHTIP